MARSATYSPYRRDADRRPEAKARDPLPDANRIREIVVDGNVAALVEEADKIGKMIADEDLKTNQIRNVFGTARQIQLRWKTSSDHQSSDRQSSDDQSYREAVLLIPKLGYYAKRESQAKNNRSEGMKILKDVLEPGLRLLMEDGISEDEKHKRFERLMDFFEAIVAYHKCYGGK
mgnify:CR=1 FL=1